MNWSYTCCRMGTFGSDGPVIVFAPVSDCPENQEIAYTLYPLAIRASNMLIRKLAYAWITEIEGPAPPEAVAPHSARPAAFTGDARSAVPARYTDSSAPPCHAE